MGPSGLWDHHEFCLIWGWWNSRGAEWIMLALRRASASFPFFPLTSRHEDEGQILIPVLTQWSFHSPASLQKQLISPGLPSLCQLLISGPPHLSRLQPLNLRLLPSQPRRYRANTAESDVSWGEAPYAESSEHVGISDGTEQRFCAAAAQPRDAVCRQK